MPDIPLQFRWQVANGGYHWLETRPSLQPRQERIPFLTDHRPIGAAGWRANSYLPLSEFPGLFREFAGAEPSYDGVKGFADRFGMLGADISQRIVLFDQRSAKRAPLGMGERLRPWTDESLLMRLAIDLWEAARKGDVERLEQVIFWTEDGSAVEIRSHPDQPDGQSPEAPAHMENASIADFRFAGDFDGRFQQGDLIKPALQYVRNTINERLKGRASPCLLWDANRERLGLYIVPDGLIGALWLQFARAVERDSQFRQCAECGIWFELARGTARSDKLYCSTPCRTKAYRKRQAEAVRLHGAGRSIDDIARALESEPDTVRGWIERKQRSDASPQGETE